MASEQAIGLTGGKLVKRTGYRPSYAMGRTKSGGL